MKYLVIFFCCLSSVLIAQEDPILQNENLIENFIENVDSDGELDFNTLFEDLEIYLKNPLDLNAADETSLKESKLLNDIQINALLKHKEEFGDLISIHELQSIPSFDLRSIRVLEPFVTVGGWLYDYNLPIKEMLKNAKSELYLKWRRVLEEQKGYEEDRDNGYQGDPNRLYLRYKFYHENRFRIGFLAEKDAGESFFSGANKEGFDFYSGHIHLKEYSQLIKDFIVGDYTVSMGQGLILHNGFGSNKSAYVMDIKKGGRQLRSYNSINEINYYRGVATTLGITDDIKLTLFGSKKKVDAGIFSDTTDIDVGLETFSSFKTDGFHRTESEIEKKGTLGQTSIGGSLTYSKSKYKIGFNGLYEQLDNALERNDALYNLFRFKGDKIYNGSVDYSFRHQNMHLFGESAIGQNGAMAHLHGLLIGMDKKVDLAFQYRNFAADYQILNGNAFAETQGVSNESGFYTGLIVRPVKNWTVSTYFDLWKHPWLRFRQDAPSVGKEFLININYYRKRKSNFYIQYKYEQKEENAPLDLAIDRLSEIQLHRLRLHFDYKLSKALSLRNRIEFSHHTEVNKVSKGYLLFQDIIYKPIASKISFTARYSIFDIHDFDSRIFTYENDLIYEFFIPSFSGRGNRYYLNFRYDLTYNITCEFRYARTHLDFKRTSDGEIIRELSHGSGLDESLGPDRTELKAQIRFKF